MLSLKSLMVLMTLKNSNKYINTKCQWLVNREVMSFCSDHKLRFDGYYTDITGRK